MAASLRRLNRETRDNEEVRVQSPLGGRLVAGDCDDPVEAVVALAYGCLQATGRRALWGIECEVENGVLILQGTVSTFYEKQLAQAVLLSQPEITAISNRIYVTVRQ
jgi:hypothetical protein